MNDLDPNAHFPEKRNDAMQVEASSEPERRISRYIGPLVIGAGAVQAAIAGGISEAFGAENAADMSFTFAATCVIGALGGAVFAHRRGRGTDET
jgi:hypothetical protein